MTASLTRLTLTQARDGLRKRSFSARELTQAYLDACAQGQDLNAYITLTPEKALAQADASDKRLSQGQGLPLDGLPLGIKDLFCTQGVRTTAASKMLAHFVPPYESAITERLWNGGAVMLGKTNLDEFAMGSANLTSAFGPVKNPWTTTDHNKTLVPGGSSGGSAAVVAGGLAVASLGTDTGGSIRQPAAFCGIVGLKPTYGRCPRRGTVAFASSLDQAGPMTRTVADAAALLEVIAGHDPAEATSSRHPVPPFSQALGKSIRGLKIGVPKEYQVDGMSGELTALWEQGCAWLKAAGAEIVTVTLPHTPYALPIYHIVASAEASSNLARYDGVRYGERAQAETLEQMYALTRDEGFGAEVKRRIMMGTYALSHGYYDAYFLKAQRVRRLVREDFDHAFSEVDVLLTPTAPTGAFAIGEEPQDPVTMYLNDVLTVPASLAGIPAISVPAALSEDGRPLGLQIIGRAWCEETVLQVAEILEQSASFPPLPFTQKE
jgi:aspartyl-tRNA(Asn)/glutamyl-tRNA(Gln) amidotransferase subunit A